MDTQEQTIHQPNAANRGIDLMSAEMGIWGEVTPELQAMVLDEELTHAVEILAAQEKGYGVVPRTFYQRGDDLIDIHNQGLRQVLGDGIRCSEAEIDQEILGADWEVERRRAELNNLDTIVAMPANSVCVEISAPPVDKPEDEQLAQHYTGLTMVRVSIKGETNKISQYNYALPISSPEFLHALQYKLGVEPQDHSIDPQRLLETPIIQKLDQPAAEKAREVDNLVGASLLEVAMGHSALRMIKKAIENRRETWEFVSSDTHADIHQELLDNMQQASLLDQDSRHQEMAAIRSGFWKELKDRFNGRRQIGMAAGILQAAASRAVAAGDVFIACGNTVYATEFTSSAMSNSGSVDRSRVVRSLRKEVKGSGSCGGCGAKGTLYGCGLCQKCNKKWCDEYERSGKQLDIKNLAYLNYSRSSDDQAQEGPIRQHLRRIEAELEAKRLARLERDEQLANAA